MEVVYFRLVGMSRNPISYSESILFEDLFSFLHICKESRELLMKERKPIKYNSPRHHSNKLHVSISPQLCWLLQFSSITR